MKRTLFKGQFNREKVALSNNLQYQDRTITFAEFSKFDGNCRVNVEPKFRLGMTRNSHARKFRRHTKLGEDYFAIYTQRSLCNAQVKSRAKIAHTTILMRRRRLRDIFAKRLRAVRTSSA